ncbi:MAG: type I restriction enzyme HsdR N-terminal domain-containing protein [Chitinophagaceae bacterium]
MVTINYPAPGFRIRNEQGKEFIFDSLRKKWLLLTPEEWVRQNFVQYLLQVRNYPAALLAIEKELVLGELKKRFDILVYDTDHQPWMMIECKAATIKLDDAVLQQVLRYNISVPVNYLVITNGSLTYAWQRNGNNLELIDELPAVK